MAAVAPLPIPPEEWAYVLFAEPGEALWHQRYRLGSLAGSWGSRDIAATPDGDAHEESLHLPDPDVAAVRFASSRWPPPAGIPRERSYRFARNISQAQMAAFMLAAEAEAVLHPPSSQCCYCYH